MISAWHKNLLITAKTKHRYINPVTETAARQSLANAVSERLFGHSGVTYCPRFKLFLHLLCPMLSSLVSKVNILTQ